MALRTDEVPTAPTPYWQHSRRLAAVAAATISVRTLVKLADRAVEELEAQAQPEPAQLIRVTTAAQVQDRSTAELAAEVPDQSGKHRRQVMAVTAGQALPARLLVRPLVELAAVAAAHDPAHHKPAAQPVPAAAKAVKIPILPVILEQLTPAAEAEATPLELLANKHQAADQV